MNSLRRTTPLRLLALGAVPLSLAGCNAAAGLEGPDMAYLTRQSNPVRVKADFFPASVGSRWRLEGIIASRSFTNELAVVGTRRIGGVTGAVFETRIEGKPVQQEVYAVTREGVVRLAGGSRGEMQLVPPMPLIRYPVYDGDSYRWSGRMKMAAGEVPAEAYCEVSGPETRTTTAGRFPTYRVDMAITVRIGGQEQHIPSTLWFAPNVGLVKQETAIMGRQSSTELASYKVR